MSQEKNFGRDGSQLEEKFDRQAYLKEVRNKLLRNLGLPEDTKPEQVAKLLEIKARLKK